VYGSPQKKRPQKGGAALIAFVKLAAGEVAADEVREQNVRRVLPPVAECKKFSHVI
jgi:hypothetical protein